MGIQTIGLKTIGIHKPKVGLGINWAAYWAGLISATVEQAAPTHVVLTFPTAQPSLIATDFTIAGFTVNSASWAGSVLTLVLAETVGYDDVLVVTFVRTGGTAAVTNNIIPYFITTWNTENAGSATKTIVIPTTGAGYDAYIDWGDGSAEENAVGTPGNITHVYAITGIKTVKIRGLFPRIYFNNAGDKLKILTIAQWGNIVWSSMALAFYGCANLTGTYTDVADTSAVTEMSNMFRSCSVFNSPVNFDTSNVTLMNSMFNQSSAFNQSVASFDTAKVASMAYMFNYSSAFNQSVASFDVSLVTDMTNMFFGAFKMTTANYDALLIAWNALSVQNSVPFHAGTATYTQTLVDSGTTDGTTANKLVDSTQNFVTTVTIGDVIRNTTDGTYAIVTAIDSDTQLSLSVDIMVSGENYTIQHSDAAKGRAYLVITHLWTITDGGPI